MEEALGSVIRRMKRSETMQALFGLVLTVCFGGSLYGQTQVLNVAKIMEAAADSNRPTQSPVQNPTPASTESSQIAQGFLYVEPYQARFEALIDARRVLQWLNPLNEVPAILDPAIQKSVAAAATKQAADWCRLSAGTIKLEGHFIGASIIKGKPGATLPFEEGAEIATSEAMIGFTWEFPTPPAPEELSVLWQGFYIDLKKLPIRVFFGRNSEMLEVSSARPKTTWEAQGRLPMPEPLAKVPELTAPATLRFPLATGLWIAAGFCFYGFIRIRDHHLPGGSLPFIATWVLGAVLSWPLLNVNLTGSATIPSIKETSEAEAILAPLLRNVYRAFDHRAESEIYDVLALSVDGELLRKLYLETIQALTLDGREGTRITISEFSADILKVSPSPQDQGFITDVQWTALGTVGHWGHAHTRVNRYTAKVTVSPIQSAWKITQLDVIEARRL